MAEQNLRIVTFGKLAPGFTRETAESNLARLCKYDKDKLARLFSGEKSILKANLDNQSAKNYMAALNQTGIVCQVEQPPPVVPKVTCPKCGTTQYESVSCIQCMVVMSKYSERAQTQMHTDFDVSAEPVPKQKRGVPYIAIVLLLLLVGGASAFFSTEDSSSGTKDQLEAMKPATALKNSQKGTRLTSSSENPQEEQKKVSSLQKLQSGFESIFKSNDDIRKELNLKKSKLAAFEKAIVDIGNQFERLEESGPICPTTGRKAITTISQDPRDDLREKCEVMRVEISLLEEELRQ